MRPILAIHVHQTHPHCPTHQPHLHHPHCPHLNFCTIGQTCQEKTTLHFNLLFYHHENITKLQGRLEMSPKLLTTNCLMEQVTESSGITWSLWPYPDDYWVGEWRWWLLCEWWTWYGVKSCTSEASYVLVVVRWWWYLLCASDGDSNNNNNCCVIEIILYVFKCVLVGMYLCMSMLVCVVGNEKGCKDEYIMNKWGWFYSARILQDGSNDSKCKF